MSGGQPIRVNSGLSSPRTPDVPAENPLLVAALAYAQHGWPVFPCGPRGKRPLVPKGFRAATRDPDTIRRWWRDWPHANIGIPCRDAFMVLDIDGPDGSDALVALAREHGQPIPATLEATTGRGRHLYFAACGLRNNVGKLAPHVDVRGDGGYVIVPPSIHQSGAEYKWVNGKPFTEWPLPLPELPEWAQALARGRTSPRPPNRGSGAAKAAQDGKPIIEGQRNDWLFRMGCSLRAKGLGGDAISAALHAENATRCRPLLPDGEVSQIARQAAGYASGSSSGEAEPRQESLLTQHRTDLGNAERLKLFAGLDLRYCHSWGVWLRWNGRCWARCGSGQHRGITKDMLRECYRLADGMVDGDARTAFLQHVLRSEASKRIDAMLTLAQDQLAVSPNQLDSHSMLLNCRNGTLELQSGELRQHDRTDYLTRHLEVDFDPDAKCPTWEAFLFRILGDSVSLMEFMQRAIGYSLCGVRTEKALFLLHGESGDNGKSTLVETLRALLGPYARNADFATFISSPNDKRRPRDDLAALFGARLVSAAEPDQGMRFSVSTIKTLTGMDQVTCRHLYGRPFEYRPEFAIWLACNHLPRVPDTGDPTWRRLRTIPFNVRIPQAEQDKALGDKLRAELPGILAWAVRGCLKWLKEGLYDAPEVRAATLAYRAENDQLGRFLGDENTVLLTDFAKVRNPDLYDAYDRWCKQHGEESMISRKSFPTELRGHGYHSTEAQHVILWSGIGLVPKQVPS